MEQQYATHDAHTLVDNGPLAIPLQFHTSASTTSPDSVHSSKSDGTKSAPLIGTSVSESGGGTAAPIATRATTTSGGAGGGGGGGGSGWGGVSPALLHRRSLGRVSQPSKRRVSGSGGNMPASHYSKPIEIPLAGFRIEASSIADTAGADTARKSLGRDDHASVDFQSPATARRATTKSGNALKKQVRSMVPGMAKIAAGGRRRKKVKDGEVVFKGHRNWEIVLSIQFGLKYTSELLDDANDTDPIEKDYEENTIFDFVPDDEQRTLFDVNRFTKWVHPAPFVFRKIRQIFTVSEEDFLDSTCSESRVRELPTPGKSGALFYITDDENYFMKTIQYIEEKMLLSMLPSYYKHILENPKTFLTKYMALFNVQTRRNRHIRMVVMASIFNENIFVDRKYDLKGSTYKRFASPSQLQSENVTLKDQDFENAVYFRPEVLQVVLDQLEKDSAYLESHSVMDYSLLLGLSDMLPEENESFRSRFGPTEEDAPYFVGYQRDKYGRKSGVRVCMGIIDFLQRFRLRKKVEYAGRVLQSCSASSASVAPPRLYRDRFMAFLKTRFLSDPHLDVSKLVTTALQDTSSLPTEVEGKNVEDDHTE